MESEILICNECSSEFDLIYSRGEIVASTPCKCRPANQDKERLKYALQVIEKDVLEGKYGVIVRASFIKHWRYL